MGKWITGDVHVHSHCCGDGSLSVAEIVEHAQKYCDFIAISGHARHPDLFRVENQYAEVVEMRRHTDMPIFNTGEIEYPVPRHVIVLTPPENREYELLMALIERYDRRLGIEGIEPALEELRFIEQWGGKSLLIFNHPNAPDVPLSALQPMAESPVFKVMACVDRGERRAPQVWDIGAEWDSLLMRGHRIYARCGSDFHRHFNDGGTDYYPGEFVQDHLWVENNTYEEIIDAYRAGRFYCTVANAISNPVWEMLPSDEGQRLRLAFDVNLPLEQVEIIGDGRSLKEFRNLTGRFEFEGILPKASYYRVRGLGRPQPRAYGQSGEFEPLFLLNPLFAP